MTKKELIKKIAENTDSSKKEISKIIECFLTEVSEGIKNEETIILRDFGTFKKTIQKARKGRNPATGEIINIPEKEKVSFKPSKNILNYKWI